MQTPGVKAVLILDSDGARICAKYYDKSPEFATRAAQNVFESKLFAKTKLSNARTDGDIVMIDNIVGVFRMGTDSFFYVIGSSFENELILSSVLDGLYSAVGMLLRGQLERRVLLDNLEMVLLAVDELVDGGIILETDATAIANRVLMRGVEGGGEAPMAELTFAQAVSQARDQIAKSFLK